MKEIKASPIKGVSDEVQEFLTCIVLHMLIPLLPLLIETWKMRGNPTDSTLVITASMYAVSIGLSSRNKSIFSLCFFVSILLSMAFGLILGAQGNSIEKVSLPAIQISSIAVILFVFIIHACERCNKHVVECQPFWNFKGVN